MSDPIKIALIITDTGVESITLLSDGSDGRQGAINLCEFFESEIDAFDAMLKKKIGLFNCKNEKH